MSFMAEPSKVLKSYLDGTSHEDAWFQYGMLAMALEIITRIKVLEALPVTTDVGRQEAIVCLHTLLTEIGLADIAYEWYDRLAEWRKPKFTRDADVLDPDALASAVVALRGVRALGDDTGGPALERPRSDPADGSASGS